MILYINIYKFPGGPCEFPFKSACFFQEESECMGVQRRANGHTVKLGLHCRHFVGKLDNFTILQFSNFHSVVEVNVFTLLEQLGEFSLNDTVVMDVSADWLKVNDIERFLDFTSRSRTCSTSPTNRRTTKSWTTSLFTRSIF